MVMERVGQQHILQSSTFSAGPSTCPTYRPPTPSPVSSPTFTPPPSTFSPLEQPLTGSTNSTFSAFPPFTQMSSTSFSLSPFDSPFTDMYPHFSSYTSLLVYSGPLPALDRQSLTPPSFGTPYLSFSYFRDTHLSRPPSTMSLSPIIESHMLEHSHTLEHSVRAPNSTRGWEESARGPNVYYRRKRRAS